MFNKFFYGFLEISRTFGAPIFCINVQIRGLLEFTMVRANNNDIGITILIINLRIIKFMVVNTGYLLNKILLRITLNFTTTYKTAFSTTTILINMDIRNLIKSSMFRTNDYAFGSSIYIVKFRIIIFIIMNLICFFYKLC